MRKEPATAFVWRHPAPPCDRDEASLTSALCMAFDLKLNEGRLLTQLLLHNHCTATNLHAAVPTLTLGSAKVFLSMLRRKLAKHDIWVNTVHKLGYGLRTEARAKIFKELAKYDAGIAAAQLQTKPETVEPNT
jgi:hypothetical protein